MANIQEYELEYNGHINAAQEKLELAESASGAEAQKAACGAAERAAEAAKDVVQLMELEGRGLSGAQRSKLQERLRSCRQEVSSLRERIKAAAKAARTPGRGSTPNSAQRSEDRIREDLFAGNDSSSDREDARMLSNNERVAKSTERLNAAHQVTLDMEGTANSILGDLSKQRETLNHARGTIKFAADGLDKGKRLINQMARRAAMNKLTMYGVIALLVGMILLVMWASSGGGSSSSAPAAAVVGEEWQKKPAH
jgi:vesicle transport through interaction with t-SNAREs protein 1